jgi:hypothetical protein
MRLVNGRRRIELCKYLLTNANCANAACCLLTVLISSFDLCFPRTDNHCILHRIVSLNNILIRNFHFFCLAVKKGDNFSYLSNHLEFVTFFWMSKFQLFLNHSAICLIAHEKMEITKILISLFCSKLNANYIFVN